MHRSRLMVVPMMGLLAACDSTENTSKPAGGDGNEVSEADEGLPYKSPEMMNISPGKFQMGSPDDEAGRDNDELLHTVTISKTYLIGKTEVTQALYEHVMLTVPNAISRPWATKERRLSSATLLAKVKSTPRLISNMHVRL